MTNVSPPGDDDATLEPPPTTDAEETRRRNRISLGELVVWYLRRRLPLDVKLRDWRPDVEGRG